MNLDARKNRLHALVLVEVPFWTMLAMLGLVIAIGAAEIGAPDWIGANRPTYQTARAILAVLLGLAAGRAAFNRLRRLGHLGKGSPLILGAWMGAGLAIGDWLGVILPPMLRLTARRPWGSLPVEITIVGGGVGAWLALTRSGLTPAATPAPSAETQPRTRVPLADADLTVVQEGLALLDRLDGEFARLSSGAIPASALTKATADGMYAVSLEYSELCARVPKGHPVLIPMLDSGMAYPTAIRLRFLALGAHHALEDSPGRVEWAQLIADRYHAPTSDFGQVADVVWREARRQRNKAADAAGLPTNYYVSV
jgi:hypothetical protein